MRTSRRTLVALLTALLLVGSVLAPGATAAIFAPGATAATGERVLDYRVEYVIEPDGTLKAKDTITYQFPEGEEHRGIYVFWPVRLPITGDPDHYRLYPLQVTGVSSPTGAPATYTMEDEAQSVGVRIGDKDRYVEGRQHTYVVSYTVRGTMSTVTNDGRQHQELYVNPVGNRWEVPIDRVSVSITAPAAAQGTRCFVGAQGSTDTSRCAARAGTTSTFTASGLDPLEGMTTVSTYPLGMVSNTEPIIRSGDARSGGGVGENMPVPAAQAATAVGYGAGVLVPVITALLMGLLFVRRGRDERYAGLTPGVAPADGAEGHVTRGGAGPIAVRFSPPDDTTPALVGTVVDETANTVDVSATVVDLAVRGYLTIEELGDGRKADWRLSKTDRSPAGELLEYENRVYEGLFASGDTVDLSDLKNHFATTLALTKKSLYREVVDRNWFRRSPEATRNAWTVLGLLVVVIGVSLLFLLGMASPSIDRTAGVSLGVPSGIVLGLGVTLAGAVILFFGRRMPAKTAAGSAVNAQALGFKQYLSTAEAHQIRFEEASAVFSRYLPYAIVFGVAERWAEVFKDVAESARAQGYDLDMPAWYVFYGMPHFASFDGIADGMDQFATMAAGTFTSTPGSSGQSGFSGGGGFAGGGGFGGGGGGSW